MAQKNPATAAAAAKQYAAAMPPAASGDSTDKLIHKSITPLKPSSESKRHLELIRNEWNVRRPNDLLRERDENFVDGDLPPGDGQNLPAWIREIKLNQLKPAVELVVSGIASRRMYPKIYANAGDGQPNIMNAARAYDLRSRAMTTMSKFHIQRRLAIESAARSGDGFVWYGIYRDADGGLHPQARYVRWNHLLFDSARTDASGDIDRGEFVCEIMATPLTSFLADMPKEFHDKARQLAQERLPDSNSAFDTNTDYDWGRRYWERQAGSAISTADQAISDDRLFVSYGVFYFREKGRIYRYAFLTDRGLTELIPITAPIAPYSHPHYPFLRWVSGLYWKDNMPYSPLVQNKAGFERATQNAVWALFDRLGKRPLVVSPDAIPQNEHGQRRMTIAEYRADVARERAKADPLLYERTPGSIRQMDGTQGEVEQVARVIQLMRGWQAASGGSMDAVLTGGDAKAHSGVELRMRQNSMMMQSGMLVMSDETAMERLGMMNICFVRDYQSQIEMAAYIREDGDIEGVAESGLDFSTIDMRAIAAGHLGVAVQTQERKADLHNELLSLITEISKRQDMPREVVMNSLAAVLKEAGPFSSVVDIIMNAAAKEGIPVADQYLSADGREQKRQITAQQEEQQKAQIQLDQRERGAEISKTEAEAEQKKADAAYKQAQADAINRGESPSGGDKGGGETDEDKAALLSKLDRLEAENKLLRADASAAARRL